MSEKKPQHLASGGRARGRRGNRGSFLGQTEPEKPYPKWAKDNTSTVPNDPANQINRAKGEPQKAAPGVKFNNNNTTTINDGTTDVVVSHLNKPEVPQFGNLPAEKQHYPPCINPTCKSFGKSHPNCLCYSGPGGSSLEQGHFASGGFICSGPHKKDCEHFADGGQVEEQQRFLNHPQDSLDHVAAQHGLLHLLTKLGHNGQSKNQHKHLEDYVDASRRGHKAIDSHIKSLIGPDKMDMEPDKDGVSSLKEHLESLQQNPEKALDIGGHLGSTLPMHGAALGAKAANAMNYFQSLKPQQSQNGPLDKIIPANKANQSAYERQLGIAQNPSLVLHHAKKGTLQPQDLKTLQTLYPALSQSMTSKAGEALIDAKQNGLEMPYRQKQGLSDLMGQPLDTTLSIQAMQAIIKANASMQSSQTQKQSKKASGTELNQIDKADRLSATPIQDRQMDKKE